MTSPPPKCTVSADPPADPPADPHDGQIRDEKQNCFCGILFLGFLGKDLGNPYLSTDIFNVYFGGGTSSWCTPWKCIFVQGVRQKWPPPPPKYTLN